MYIRLKGESLFSFLKKKVKKLTFIFCSHMLTIPEFTPWLRRNYSFFSSTSMKITEAIVKHQFTIYCDEEPPNKSLGIKTVYYTLKESQAELYRQYKNTKISALPKGPQYSDDLIGEFLTIFPSSFFDLDLWRLLIEE